MGQPKVASVTWRDRIRRISQGFYETMGQQIPQTRASEPMRAWSHVKILNRDLRSTVIFLRKPKGISQTFRLRGRHCKNFSNGRETWISERKDLLERSSCLQLFRTSRSRL